MDDDRVCVPCADPGRWISIRWFEEGAGRGQRHAALIPRHQDHSEDLAVRRAPYRLEAKLWAVEHPDYHPGSSAAFVAAVLKQRAERMTRALAEEEAKRLAREEGQREAREQQRANERRWAAALQRKVDQRWQERLSAEVARLRDLQLELERTDKEHAGRSRMALWFRRHPLELSEEALEQEMAASEEERQRVHEMRCSTLYVTSEEFVELWEVRDQYCGWSGVVGEREAREVLNNYRDMRLVALYGAVGGIVIVPRVVERYTRAGS